MKEQSASSTSPPPLPSQDDQARRSQSISEPAKTESTADGLAQTSIPQTPHQHQHHHHPLAQFNHVTDSALLMERNLDRSLMDSPSLAAPTPDFPIDPALGGILPEHSQYQVNTATQHMPISPTYRSPSQPAQVGETAGSAGSPTAEDVKPTPQPGPSKRSSIVEDNDQELRRLAQENQHIPLKDLANRVRNDENGPHAEKSRQILGMIWLKTSCERAADTSVAVPRNRVYARYVSMCANERIKPLNPASFGKLVRLMYPEIKTRRLGVRGQSKYHYCGINLKGEHTTSPNPKTSKGLASGLEHPPQISAEDHLLPNGITSYFTNSSFPSGHAYCSPNLTSFQNSPDLSPIAKFLQQEIFFVSNDIDEFSSSDTALILPNIIPHAPSNVDPDVAASLTAIYRSHLTSLVECVRFMRLKQFFALFISFQGTLTAPVQKLFSEPSIAPWIRESDWSTYKRMIQLLSPLALQVLPAQVLSHLRHFSASLTTNISATFSNQPQHVIEAKILPATIFSNLLDRLLRVNEAAHAAARILVHAPDRSLMRQDWRKYVNCKAIVEREVACSPSAVVRILDDEILSLLQPDTDSMHPAETSPSPGCEEDVNVNVNLTTESVLDRWTQFLNSLPLRFPSISARLFLLTVGAVASAALRDMTMAGGESFGAWWVVRCWVDEWLAWQAEKGGFLRHGQEPSCKPTFPANVRHTSVGTVDGDDELGPDDSGISLREEGISVDDANAHNNPTDNTISAMELSI